MRFFVLASVLALVGCGGDGDEKDASGGNAGVANGGSGGSGNNAGSGATSSGGSGAGTGTGGASTGGAGGVGPPGDFAARCADPGVVRCVGFDSPADIAGQSGDPTGILSGEATPELDTGVKASGESSLKFTVPSNSPADTSGSYFANFSDDLSVQFDSGEEFFVQWRQRFGADFLTTDYAGGGGWKQVIIGEGSRPGEPAYSCTTLEVVTVNGYHRGFPTLYHSCGVKDSQYEPLEPPIPPDDFGLQNAIAGCTYHNQKVPPCAGYIADQWMTFQVHVKIGTWYKNDGVYHHDSVVQLWVAEEGQPSKLVIDMSPGDPSCNDQQTSLPSCKTGYDLVNDNIGKTKYGQVWLLPYNTGKDDSVSYPETATWYDELIISKNQIPDPLP